MKNEFKAAVVAAQSDVIGGALGIFMHLVFKLKIWKLALTIRIIRIWKHFFMTSMNINPNAACQSLRLDQLPCHTRAEVLGMNRVSDDEDRSVALRLLEIGFLPGECVRVIAHGFPGHDPLAVRVGHSTFALRRHEAALVQVRLSCPTGADHAC